MSLAEEEKMRGEMEKKLVEDNLGPSPLKVNTKLF